MEREGTRRRTAPGGRAAALGLAVALAFLGAACGDDGDTAEDTADIYTTVIRTVAPGPTSTMPKVVFVELDGGAELSLEDQAAVVNAFDAPVTVRFIDDLHEAVDDDLPQSRVRRDGVLVRLRPTTSSGAGIGVRVTRYVARDDEHTVCVELTEADQGWTVTSAANC